MSLLNFAQEYAQLTAGEQSLFADSVRRLLAEGLIWREEESDRKIYNFLARRGDLVRDYLAVAGWDLHWHELAGVYQVVHREGAHRRRFDRDTTLWLLIMRLLYAEKREKLVLTLTRYPVVTVGDVAERYNAYFPNQRVRKQTSLTNALRILQSLKLIRAARGGVLRAQDSEKQIELLPALEVIVPADSIAQIAERLQALQTTPTDEAEISEAEA